MGSVSYALLTQLNYNLISVAHVNVACVSDAKDERGHTSAMMLGQCVLLLAFIRVIIKHMTYIIQIRCEGRKGM